MAKPDLVEQATDVIGPRVTKRDCGLGQRWTEFFTGALGAEEIRHRSDVSPAGPMRRLFSLGGMMEHATCLGFAPKPGCAGGPSRDPQGVFGET